MFGFNSNKSHWEKIASNCGDYYFKEAINSLMIPFNISVKKFAINMDCMENGNSYSYQYCSGSTGWCGDWCSMPRYERPMGFDDWFYAAFGDVAHWIQTAPGRAKLDELKNEFPDDDVIGSNGRFRINVLKSIIQKYINSNPRIPLEASN